SSCSARGLSSFPTRRSSDLAEVLPVGRIAAGFRIGDERRSRRAGTGNGTDDHANEAAANDGAHAALEFLPGHVGTRHGGLDVLRSEEHTSELQSREKLVCRL